jgi:hypothetical protein
MRPKAARGSRSPRGRPALPQVEYARLAKRYAELCQAGVKAPLKTLAKERGEALPKTRSAIARARSAPLAFLKMAAIRGAASAEITEHCRHVLKAAGC